MTTNMLRRLLPMMLLALALTFAGAAFAQPAPDPNPANQMPSVVTVPKEALPSPNFSADVATKAYLAQIPAAATARSNAYFEGGYWLILWDFLYGAVVALILLNLRISAKMRNIAEGITRFKFLQTMIYWAQFSVVGYILSFPLGVYEGFFREHQYGLATQNFGAWLGDEGKGILLNMLLGGIAIAILFAIVRRLQKTWWIWGSIVAVGLMVIGVAIGPVFIQPIFNNPKILNNPKITAPILSLARANGIPAHDVYEIDASKQTNRMSANVSGFGSTMRVTLNDNLIKRASPEEVQAVMGHEMGHYVLNHIPKDIIFFLVVIVTLFAGLNWSVQWALARWGEKWQIRGIADPAVMPLVVLCASIFFFVLTPVMNSHTRTAEHEADMYGINASRQPDGFAQAAIHLGEYRKMEPGYWEEVFFFDHSSGRNRIHDAMQWKAENLGLFPVPAIMPPEGTMPPVRQETP